MVYEPTNFSALKSLITTTFTLHLLQKNLNVIDLIIDLIA